MSGVSSTVLCVLTVDLAPDFCLEHPVLQKLWRLTITVVKAIVQVLSLFTGTKEEAVLMIETSWWEMAEVQVGIVDCEGMPDTLELELINKNRWTLP